jgi:hypothetical protein
MEPGAELFGANADATEVRAMLDRFPDRNAAASSTRPAP